MKNIILALGFLSGTLISFFYSIPALAGRTVTVPAIQLQKAGSYVGQYATIYYGFEKTTIIHADRTLVSLSQIRLSQTRPITGDTMQFPSVKIDKEGIRGAYDIVVVVISHFPNFSWRNADGSLPFGITDTRIYENSSISFHKAAELDSYILKNPTAAYFPWVLTTSNISR